MPRKDETTAAFGIYPKQRAKASSPETIKGVDDLVKLLGDIVLPKDAVDVGLMALPFAGNIRKLGAALIAGGATTDAEAGGLSALMRLLSKEAPAQARQIREALGRAYTSNVEHSVVGSADKGPAGSIVSGTYDSVAPNQFDIARALKSNGSIADFHTHPAIGQTAFDISPSSSDFRFASNEYFPGKQDRELRTIIASPADPGSRSPSAYSFFATDNPSKVFDKRKLDAAVFELQRGGSKGTFKSVIDDPRFREYFDYGGSMGELVENIAPLSLLDLRKAQGMGRGEVVLSGRPLSQNSESTNTELFKIMNPSAVELLTRKGFAEGGAVHMDEGGAAFGVFPQMKARRAKQDREAAANAPLSALRGYAAGTAGLPGDIEGLARMAMSQVPSQFLNAFPALRAFGIGSRADPTPQMPTTEFYNEYLPGAQLNETPTGKAFTTAGNLLGGTGSTTLARYGIKSAKAAGQALGPTAVRIGEEYLERQGLMPGVIKPKGGNFLSGSVEESVSPLKRRVTPSIAFSQEEADDLIARGFVRDKSGGEGYYLPPDPVNNFIDKKIAPYIRNEMATPDDPLRAMAEKYAVDKPVKLAEVQGRIDAFAAKMKQEARERGVPVEMLTSMRQQMIGLEKEKALLEAREGLHSELFTPNPDDIQNLGDVRYAQGFEPGGMGQSEQARIWEDLADVAFDEPSQAGTHWSEAALQTDPWLRKVPPETPVYGEYLSTNNLGFRHLVDELRNATNPASGLPANLLIDPADLGKFTMPQAVDRVADINAWRATQRIEANQAIANNAATFLHKDYPTIPGTDKSNKFGLRWMQIRHDPSLNILPKGLKGKQEGDEYVIRNSKGQIMVSHDNYDYAFDDLKENFPKYFKNDPLKNALKYEGDAMGHSVGGYGLEGSYGAGGIDAIRQGEASIYSLRDAKGQPQVTIETRPGYTIFDTGKPEGRPGPERIIQIKGKSNRKPADEYLPFVQDFVKSGNWSEVNDLQNTGLRRVTDAFNENEIKKIQGAGIEVPTWATPDEIKTIGDSVWPGQYGTPPGGIPEGMAQGGLVSNHFDPIKIKQIIAGLDDEYDPENIQQIIAQRESAYA
jgi:hypothetical protein